MNSNTKGTSAPKVGGPMAASPPSSKGKESQPPKAGKEPMAASPPLSKGKESQPPKAGKEPIATSPPPSKGKESQPPKAGKDPTAQATASNGNKVKESSPTHAHIKQPEKEKENKEKEKRRASDVGLKTSGISSNSKPPISPKLAPQVKREPVPDIRRNRSRSPRREETADLSDLPALAFAYSKSSTNLSTGLTAISSFFGMQGRRDTMEDEHLDQDLSYQSFEHLGLHATPTRPLKLYAIFDGHCGNECAKFAGKVLAARLREKLNNFNRKGVELTVHHLLVFTLEDLDREFMETHMRSEAGCTAVVCLIDTVQKSLFCANIGDSRAIIGRKLNHLPLTRDQDGLNPQEARRVEGSGGTIDKDGYVNDTVNMTRSLGDRSGKFRTDVNGFFSRNFAIVSAPEVRQVPLTDTHMFLLLACDGLFEPGVFTSTQIVQRARQLLTEEFPNLDDIKPADIKSVAKTLCQEAHAKGSNDNMSVMIVCFC